METLHAIDPITGNIHDIHEWVNYNRKDNIIIRITNDPDVFSLEFGEPKLHSSTKNLDTFCMKRSYFFDKRGQIPPENLIDICTMDSDENIVFDRNIFNIKNYMWLGSHINLSKYNLIHNVVVNVSDFTTLLSTPDPDDKKLYGIDIVVMSDKSFLGLSIHDLQLYNQLHQAFYKYSYQWDSPINLYLRLGEDYFKSDIFLQYVSRYGNTEIEAQENIKENITLMDSLFLKYAPRNKNNMFVVYRGMTAPYPISIGESMILPSFLSTTHNFDIIPDRFYDKTSDCCIYQITMTKGIPYFDMKHTTKFSEEDEILLPRNLVIQYTHDSIYNYNKYRPYTVKCLTIQPQSDTQFEINHEKMTCNQFHLATLLKSEFTDINPSKIITNTIDSEFTCPHGSTFQKEKQMCQYKKNQKGLVKKETLDKTMNGTAFLECDDKSGMCHVEYPSKSKKKKSTKSQNTINNRNTSFITQTTSTQKFHAGTQKPIVHRRRRGSTKKISKKVHVLSKRRKKTTH
jgi:hypothetical protein